MRLRQSILCFALAACSLPACSIFDPDEWAERRETLQRSRDRWAAEAAQTYRYEFRKSCECIPGFAGDVVIEVTDDAITALTPLREGVDVPEEQWPAFDTVEEMFQLIEIAIDERARHFDVEYDPQLGHPTLINLDFRENVVDDELTIHVSDLEILEQWPTLQ